MPSIKTIPVEKRSARIKLRAQSSQCEIIDKAAQLVGKSRSAFILDVAYREAMDVVLDQRLFPVDEVQFQAFEAMLDNPLPVENQERIQRLLQRTLLWDR